MKMLLSPMQLSHLIYIKFSDRHMACLMVKYHLQIQVKIFILWFDHITKDLLIILLTFKFIYCFVFFYNISLFISQESYCTIFLGFCQYFRPFQVQPCYFLVKIDQQFLYELALGKQILLMIHISVAIINSHYSLKCPLILNLIN